MENKIPFQELRGLVRWPSRQSCCYQNSWPEYNLDLSTTPRTHVLEGVNHLWQLCSGLQTHACTQRNKMCVCVCVTHTYIYHFQKEGDSFVFFLGLRAIVHSGKWRWELMLIKSFIFWRPLWVQCALNLPRIIPPVSFLPKQNNCRLHRSFLKGNDYVLCIPVSILNHRSWWTLWLKNTNGTRWSAIKIPKGK